MRVYFVTVDSGGRTVPSRAIEYMFRESDWLRMQDGSSYFVATADDPEAIYRKLRSVLHENDEFIVAEVKPGGFSAFMPTAAWEWVEKYYKSATKITD